MSGLNDVRNMPRSNNRTKKNDCLKGRVNITSPTSEANSVAEEDPVFVEPPYEAPDRNRSEFDKVKWRHLCSTLNNYTPDELANCLLTAQKVATYGIIGLEVGPRTGTPHLQMYFEFGTQKRTTDLRRLISPRAYFLVRRGNPIQASSYCRGNYTTTKGEYKPLNEVVYEFGELSKQGERTDWVKARDDLNAGVSLVDVIGEQAHLMPNIRALQQYTTLVAKSKHRDLKVVVLFGPPGSGKTKWVYDNFPDAFSKPDGDWWDGYSGQSVVLLDDFYGGIPYHTMLKVADRYPLSLPVKGGFVPALYDTLVITSNKAPWIWYEKGLGALARRITEVAEVIDIHQSIEFRPLDDFPHPEGGRGGSNH